MNHGYRSLAVTPVLLALVAFGSGACGKSSPSPTAPTGATAASVAAPSSAGAVVAGAVVNGPPNVKVAVVGTTLATTADASGRFTLPGVPAGNVTLQVSSTGVSAMAAVGAVAEGEQVEVTITLNGGSATVEVGHGNDAANRGEIDGPIASMNASRLTFQVAATTVQVTSSTTIRGQGRSLSFSDLRVGERVQAKGVLQNAVLNADSIEAEDEAPGTPAPGTPTPDLNEVKGVVASVVSGTSCAAKTLAFVVAGGTTVRTTAATQFEGSCAAIAPGVTVEAKGTMSGTSLAATTVSVEDAPGDQGGGDQNEVEFTGTIAASPAPTACPAPTFSVGGVTVTTSASTRFDSGTCANAVAGASVEIKGTRTSSSGPVSATRVKFESSK